MSTDTRAEILKAQIDEWNVRIDEWESEARLARADTAIIYDLQLVELRQKRDRAQRKLQEMGHGTSEEWGPGVPPGATTQEFAALN